MKETMIYQVLLVCLLVTVDTRSVDKVNENNVTKREASGEFFPDWVPFKNKNGDELGEFVQVETKKKPKKRLAHPINFKLKAAAPDDYDDFGAGSVDGEGDDFEKKEWSDLSRTGANINRVDVNHTDLSDIDGLVNIITQPKPDLLNLIKENTKPVTVTSKPEQTTKYEEDDYLDHAVESITQKTENYEKETKDKGHKKEATTKSPDDEDYEDEKKQKEKQAQVELERKESEARKALILSAVDELKARHEAEQRILSENAKEEEIFKEQHENDKIASDLDRDKYDGRNFKLKNYDDYEDAVGSSTYDKYKINLETTTEKITTTSQRPTRRPKKTKKNKKKTKSEKLTILQNPKRISVFNHPEAYMLQDEDSATRRTKTNPKRTTVNPKIRETGKFSSKYAISSPITIKRDESVRISLVPESNDTEGSPTLFFPQTKSKRKKKRGRNSTPSPDSTVAETVESKTAKNWNPFELELPVSNVTVNNTVQTRKATDTTGSDTIIIDSTSVTPSGTDALSTNSDTITDVVAASTNKKHEKDSGNFAHKKGGGREYSSSHEEVHGEHGKKAYEGKHEETKQAKGHHDKEDHSGEYIDKAGTDKQHHDESKHYGAHHHEEHGKKHAKYEESGKHSKGHSTKGSHDIHKKEEYEKRVEFFEEDGDSSEEEKHGGYNHERGHASGGNFKKGKLEAGHHGHDKGDTGHHARGGHAHGHKGHKLAEGHDSHGRHHQAHYQKAGKQSGKKWGYVHTAPGKVANLIAIDRRADQYYAGPQYYG